MPRYMIQASYTGESWKAQVARPRSLTDRLEPVLKKLGGRLEAAYYTFGEYDVLLILEMPGNVEAAAFALVGAAGGALASIRTTPLLSVAEGLGALKAAGRAKASYRPPR
ncbi:MAG: GYD domain-containing protein [Planctomycetes bacterium]|nr:GYD domain-containing protein [Planctomycetota bacterium]